MMIVQPGNEHRLVSGFGRAEAAGKEGCAKWKVEGFSLVGVWVVSLRFNPHFPFLFNDKG